MVLPYTSSLNCEPHIAWDSCTQKLYIADAYYTGEMHTYDPATQTQTLLPPNPDNYNNDAWCANRSGHIYSAGIFPGNHMWQFDILSNTWIALPNLPFDVGNAGACTITGDGFLFEQPDYTANLGRISLPVTEAGWSARPRSALQSPDAREAVPKHLGRPLFPLYPPLELSVPFEGQAGQLGMGPLGYGEASRTMHCTVHAEKAVDAETRQVCNPSLQLGRLWLRRDQVTTTYVLPGRPTYAGRGASGFLFVPWRRFAGDCWRWPRPSRHGGHRV